MSGRTATMMQFARRHWIWTLTAAAVGITILGFSLRAYRIGRLRQELEFEMHDMGGWYIDHVEFEQGLRARTRYLLNPQWATREVMLRGPKFDDAWLRERDHLGALDITQLRAHDTKLTSQGLEGLLERSSLTGFEFQGAPLTDRVIEALSGRSRLMVLNLRGSELTDEQFAKLPLDKVQLLNIAETAVTSAALQQRLHGLRSLLVIGLDGGQCDAGTVETLADLPQRLCVNLYGQDVTDEHLERIAPLALHGVMLVNTRVTDDGIAALKKSRPACRVDVMRRQRFMMEVGW